MKLSFSALLISTAFAASCGDSLLGSEYRGEPLFSFEAQAQVFSDLRRLDAPLKAAVFWVRDGHTGLDADNLLEQPAVATGVNFPAAFEVNLFQPPSPEPPRGAAFQVGLLLIYEDRDGDGRMSPAEVVGGAPDEVLVFTHRALTAEASITGYAQAPGYALLRLPAPCQALQTQDYPLEDCGVPLGAACSSDADCNGGSCLDSSFDGGLSIGLCALIGDDGCFPEGGRVIQFRRADQPDTLLWLPACSGDADCDAQPGLTCQIGVCYGNRPVRIQLRDDFAMMPLCGTP